MKISHKKLAGIIEKIVGKNKRLQEQMVVSNLIKQLKEDKEAIEIKEKADPLETRLKLLLNNKDNIYALRAAADLKIRHELGQEDIIKDVLEVWKGKHYKDKSIYSPFYNAIKIAELLICKHLWGTCEYAKDCWVTRRGWCQKRKDKEQK